MFSKKLSPTKIFLLSLFSLVCFSKTASSLILTCTSSTTSLANYSTVLCLSSTTNATPGSCGANYPVKIQCTGYGSGGFITEIATASANCSTLGGNFVPILSYSGPTETLINNNHVADPYASGAYPALLCLGTYSTDFTNATVTSQLSNCNGYGTTLFSAPANFTTTGNVHIGDVNAYPLKRCITFDRTKELYVSISTTTVGFGILSPLATTYATSDGYGTTTAFTATSSSFYIDVQSYGNAQYSISLQGSTLTNVQNNVYTIPAIGSTPQALVPGTNQFGVSVFSDCVPASPCLSVGLRSTSTYPYNTSNYAYAGSSTTPTVIGSGQTDDFGSRFYVRLGANIASSKERGSYATNLFVVVTSEF